ncbi:MAG: hypothetical protein KDB27_08830 [Planctomycetales bacterium]|nr:hypothetical protein [Planctomycetales bacterium]
MTSCCRSSDLKADCRSCVEEYFANYKQPEYGLQLETSFVDEARAVLFVHGLNSRPEDLSSLVRETEHAGLATATFRYPNDQAISESSEMFANVLKQLSHVCPTTKLSIVTHSMGALVVRDAIENPWYKIDNVDRLVMLVPPNHGSHLAKYAVGHDIYEYAVNDARRDESGFVVGSILDGLSAATRDLKPDSAFLRRLNARRRQADVRYTIVIGTDGVVGQERLSRTQGQLARAGKRCSWFRCLSNELETKSAKYDEVVDGLGDGVVSVASARLPGVHDVIMGEFTHVDILSSVPSDEVQRVRAAILTRLVD